MKQKIRDLLNKIIKISNNPKHIAYSIAVGIFFGIMIPMGLQTLVVIPISIALRANVYLATASTLITNPITIIPIYYLTFQIGSFLTKYEIEMDELNRVIESPTYTNLSELSSNFLLTFLLGNFIFAAVTSLAAYFIVFQITKIFIARNLEKTNKNI